MKPPNRVSIFRAAVRDWQRGPSKAPPSPALVNHACQAVIEIEGEAARAKAAATARAKAALSAIDAGDLAQARAALTRIITDGEATS